MPEVRAAVEAIQGQHEFGPYITYEVATALALLYFQRQQVQHAVLEVGLGGRLDATNVTQPLVSVITSISYDHTQILGNTLKEIATEKAGIIKPDGVVVTSAQAPEALLAIAAVCRRRHARLVRAGSAEADPAQAEVEAGRAGRGQAPPLHLVDVGREQLPPVSYRYRREEYDEKHQQFTIWTPERVYTGLVIPLIGLHELENATAALATLDMLRERSIVWDEGALREGFLAVRWPARIEVVGRDPSIVVDGAHNADSMQKLIAALRETFTMHRLIVVLSPFRDKDLVGIAQALAGVDIVILTCMASPRAATIEQLQAVFAEYAPDVTIDSARDSTSAMKLALDLAGRGDLICATGSLYLAAEVLRWAAAHGDEMAAATIEGVDH
jgi:dihydrofolate synthase/folylpolyglutamate synthase